MNNQGGCRLFITHLSALIGRRAIQLSHFGQQPLLTPLWKSKINGAVPD